MQPDEAASDAVDRMTMRCSPRLHARISERARLRGVSIQDEAVHLMEIGLAAFEVEGRSVEEIVESVAQMTGEKILSGLLLAASGVPGGLTEDMLLGILRSFRGAGTAQVG